MFSNVMRRVLFSIIAVLIFCGCNTSYNLATQQEERMLYGSETEARIGNSVARQVEAHYPILDDIDANRRVRRILDRIVAVCDRKEFVYTVKIIDEDKMNAISLPGGFIYMFKGLVDKIENDDQLASVVAHEVGHIAARHGMKKLESSYGYTALQALSVASGSPAAVAGVQTAFMAMFFAYSQEDEFEADELSVKYMRAAGYDVNEVAGMLRKLKEDQDKQPLRRFSYWRTHPHIPQRISNVNRAVTGELHFRDYLNLMDHD